MKLNKNKLPKNLGWKIRELATKIELQTSKAKQNELQNDDWVPDQPNGDTVDLEAIKHELEESMRLKFETKLFHTRKEIKNVLKKSRATEIQKQRQRIRHALSAPEETPKKASNEKAETKDNTASVATDKMSEEPANKDPEESTDEDSEESTNEDTEELAGKDTEDPTDKDAKESTDEVSEDAKNKKAKRERRAADVQKLEKELAILENMDIDTFADKTLRKKILKHAALKKQPIVTDLIEPVAPEEQTSLEMQIKHDVEARLLHSKKVQEEFTKNLKAMELIFNPPKHISTEQPDKGGSKDGRKKGRNGSAENKHAGKKRKDFSGDTWEDPDFDKIYQGPKKPNRAGQRERQKMYEEIYGNKAAHLVKQREERLIKKGKLKGPKKQKKDAVVHSGPPADETQHPSWIAKKKQEELMSMALSGAITTGKKIVFDNDDD